MKTESLIELALIAAGVYLLYKAWGTAASAANASVTAAAQAYVSLTSGPAMQATGNIILPTGTAISVNDVNPTPVSGTNSATFNYLGTQYYLNTPSDSSTGDWTADTTLQ
jgi:hypothetical protein